MEKLEEKGDFIESIANSLGAIAYREGYITDSLTGEVIQQVQAKPEPKKREAPEGKTQAIPDLNLIELQKNQSAFIKIIGPIVALVELQHAIFEMHDVKNSLLCLSFLSFLILFFEVTVPLLPIGLVVMILYKRHTKAEFKRFETDYIKNIRYVQLQTAQIAQLIGNYYFVMENIVHWKDPEMALQSIKALLAASVAIFFALNFLPIRVLVVVGLWGAVLSNNHYLALLGNLVAIKLN